MITQNYKEINDVCKLHDIIENYNFEIKILREQIKNLTDKIYGRKTEKIALDPNIQLSLFDMPEPELPIADEPEEITIPAHKRKKRGRKPLPASLPRIEVIHDLKEEDKLCPCGCLKSRIGEDVSEQLDYIPARVQVIRNIRYKYACKNCEGTEDDGPTVSIASMPEQIIPKSFATPGLVAHILTAKFADALPFYRQEKQFSRIGIELPRATMCNWTMKILDACEIILDMMKNSVCKSPVINIDETPLKVLKEPDRSKSYMWVFKGTPRGKPVILYQYHPSRSSDVPAEFLKNYKGIVQTDGYAGYKFLENNENIMHVGCWVHARRKFIEVTKAAGKNSSSGNAGTALKYISQLYKIEKQAREQNLSPDKLYIKRQSEAVLILEEFKKWIDYTIEKVPPKSLLGKALHYTLGEWSNLVRYADDGRVAPDNNTVENAIRPFVVGRKNWLFSDTPKGARASAAIYSLIETAKANDLEPYKYLKHLFTHLPKAMTKDDFLALLPHNIEKQSV